jgi:DNA polymerase elongation subunit (family B)
MAEKKIAQKISHLKSLGKQGEDQELQQNEDDDDEDEDEDYELNKKWVDNLDDFIFKDDEANNPKFSVPMPGVSDQCTAYMFGVTAEGQSVNVSMPFEPYFFLEVHKTWKVHIEGAFLIKKLASDINCIPEKIKITLEKRKKSYGVHMDKENPIREQIFTFFRMSFPSIAHMNKAVEWFRKNKSFDFTNRGFRTNVEVHESRVPLSHKFLDQMNIQASGWVRIKLHGQTSCPGKPSQLFPVADFLIFPENVPNPNSPHSVIGYRSHSQIELIVLNPYMIQPVPETERLSESVPKLVIASVDIEAMSPSDRFPNARHPLCPVTAIAVTVHRFGVPGFKRFELVLKAAQTSPTRESLFAEDPDNRIELTEIICYKSEKELLNGYRDLMTLDIDPDIVTGYNILGFDLKYLSDRAAFFEPLVEEKFQIAEGLLHASQRAFFQSNLIYFRTPVVERCMSTAAKGDRISFSKTEPGRCYADVFLHCKDNMKMKKLKLDDVSHAILGKRKLPLNHEDHFALHTADIFSNKIRKMFWGLNPDIGHEIAEIMLDAMKTEKSFKDQVLSRIAEHKLVIREKEKVFVEKEKIYSKLPKTTSIPEEERTAKRDDMNQAEKDMDSAREDLGTTMRELIQKYRAHFSQEETDFFLNDDQSAVVQSQVFRAEDRKFWNQKDHYMRIAQVLRRRLSEYCWIDSLRPLQIMLKLSSVNNMVEMSRLCYTSLSDIEQRGQQIKVFSLLTTFAHQPDAKTGERYVLSNTPFEFSRPCTEKYQGATVLEPTTGFYTEPVATLDFASLYPTIMRNENLCCSTLLLGTKKNGTSDGSEKQQADLERAGCVFKVYEMDGHRYAFIQKPKRGIMPAVLDRLVGSRKKVKNLMKEETDESRKAILEAKQLAIKVVCNSVYGFTGVNPQMAMLPCKPVAMCVTFSGRGMIKYTKEMVVSDFPQKFPELCEGVVPTVIYGDTDSVMIWMRYMKKRDGESDVDMMKRVFALATAMGKYCSKMFRDAGGEFTDLEFEKVYFPYLLMAKKNYIGLMFDADEGPEEPKKIDMKGIEIVKRSVCAFVQQTAASLIPALMFHRSEDMAAQNLYTHIQRLMTNQVPLEDFIHYTKMSANYKNGGETLPQVRVRDAMAKRNPGSEPQPGDYAAYIAYEVKGKDPSLLKVADHVEHPDFMEKNGMKPDRWFILSNKLRNLVYKILQFTRVDVDKMLEEPLGTLKRQVMGIVDMRSFSQNPVVPVIEKPDWKRKAGTVSQEQTKALKKRRLEEEQMQCAANFKALLNKKA